MTRSTVSPASGILLGLSLLLSMVAATFFAPTALAAKKVEANLRVVTWQGKVLFDGKARTGTTAIKPNATCLGGRLGPARSVPGATALNLLAAAAKHSASLRPLTLTDTDYGFGICGIGGVEAKNEEWWSLRTNYKDASVGAEGLEVKANDTILLYLAKTYMEPTPDSLILKAPVKVKKGALARVRVVSSTGAGKRSPVEGAKVLGSDRLTDAKGFTWIKVNRRIRTIARKAGLIPSNRSVITIKKPKMRPTKRR